MDHFKDAVQKILSSPPTKGHFGYRHYMNGLSGVYDGPSYGRSTVMDAFYHAGKKAAKKNPNRSK